MKIGVIGACGVVGSATSFGFTKLGHQVVEHDLKLGTKIDCLLDCEIVYICVPTPSKENGECDTSIVEQVVGELLIDYAHIIAIKSTVTPFTTDKLIHRYGNQSICFCPEFLRERSAFNDFVEHNNILVVGTYNEFVYNLVIKSHGRYPKKTVMVKPIEAELVKLYHNGFNALRIIWANEFYDLCNKVGANYTEVKNCVLDSARLPDQYLDCNPKMKGFGGTCLPKDTESLLAYCKSVQSDFSLLEALVNKNKKYETTVFPNMRK